MSEYMSDKKSVRLVWLETNQNTMVGTCVPECAVCVLRQERTKF
jgi:hypothetical protein